MSASDKPPAEWPEPGFWERLDQIEHRHRRIQAEHDLARRGLERLATQDAAELRAAWRRYCEVIAELERTAAEFDVLRPC